MSQRELADYIQVFNIEHFLEDFKNDFDKRSYKSQEETLATISVGTCGGLTLHHWRMMPTLCSLLEKNAFESLREAYQESTRK